VSGILKVYDPAGGTGYARVSYDNASTTATFAASTGTTQIGLVSGNVTVPLTGSTDQFKYTKTLTAGAAYNTNEFLVQRILTGGANAVSGNVLQVEDRSTTSSTNTTTVLYVNENNTTATGFVIQAQSGGTTNLLTLDNTGNLNVKNGYQVNGTAGSSLACTSGAGLVNAAVSGGIVTAGSCSSGTGTLQTSYDNAAAGSPAPITTSSAAKTILFKAGATFDSASLFQVQTAGSVAVLTADTTNKILQVGSSTADTTQVDLALDQFSTFTDNGSCNTATNPNGAMYYNTASNAIRACIGGAWEDMTSTSGLGIMLFGVVPDSGTSDQGDLPALVTAGTSGPCKVAWASATTVNITACTAYSGGRKVAIAAVTGLAMPAMAANTFVHICLTGASSVPAVSAVSAANVETTNLPTFSATAPILCLADIKDSATTANTIGHIYDTRTFTTSQKEFVTSKHSSRSWPDSCSQRY